MDAGPRKWVAARCVPPHYESHTRSQTIGNRFQFPSFRHRVKAITRESRTLPTIQLLYRPQRYSLSIPGNGKTWAPFCSSNDTSISNLMPSTGATISCILTSIKRLFVG